MTRQLFMRADQANSDCTPADFENKPMLSSQTGGGETVTAEVPAQTMADLIFSFTMAAGDPGGGENLAASSLFTARLDISVMDSQISCTVEFHSLNAGCASQGNEVMGESAFTGTGTKTATATWDPPISDRYQVRVLAANSEGHNGADGTLTIRTNNTITDLVIPNAPPTGVPDLEMAAAQGKGQINPRFDPTDVTSYRSIFDMGRGLWLARRLVYG